jgi:FkbM family methyltransferase
MSLYEYAASSIVGTPLRRPVEAVRGLYRLAASIRHRDLREVMLEERRLRQLLKRAVTPEMNCIDVGCHLGSFLAEVKRLAPRGHHLAVEPLPYKAEWLKRKFPSVDVYQLALGEEEAIVDFFYQPRHSGFSGLRRHGGGEATTLQVKCCRLDDIIPPGRPIGLLKIDVEGGEYGVLRGARRVLAESRPLIVFECTQSGLSAFDNSASQVFSLLAREHMYHIFLFKDWLAGAPPLELADFESAMVYPFKAFNFVAVPIPVVSYVD